MSAQPPQAGWYPDPEVPGGTRYWDGAQWTESRTPPAGPAPPTLKTSGMAIASLVLGIVWFYGVTSVLAVIFATKAKRDIRESNGWVTGGGMATAGLVLGIVGIVGALIVIALIILADGDIYYG